MQLELFKNEISLEDLFNAYYDCRKNKRNRKDAMEFEIDLENNIIELWNEINSGKWEPRPSTVFIVVKPVIREIFAATFRDRIVHHLVIGKLNSLFEKIFINDSYSCRIGKGTHYGVSRAIRFFLRSSPAWVLKVDIRGYFMSINKKILYEKLKLFIEYNYFECDKAKIIKLCKIIIFNAPTKNCIYRSPKNMWKQLPKDKSLFTSKKGCGLPIGNLTSQIFANFYLNDFDHFIKKECQIKNYGRYVDDCLFIHHSQSYLRKFIPVVHKYLNEKLGLTLHPRKIYLQSCYNGVKYLGCYIKTSHVVINNRTINNFKKSLHLYNGLVNDHKPNKQEIESFISSVNSYLGILKHYKTYKKRKNITRSLISPYWYKHIIFSSNSFYKVIKRKVN